MFEERLRRVREQCEPFLERDDDASPELPSLAGGDEEFTQVHRRAAGGELGAELIVRELGVIAVETDVQGDSA